MKAPVTFRRKHFLSKQYLEKNVLPPRFRGPTLLPQLLCSLKSGPQVLEVWPLPCSGLAVLDLPHQRWKGLVKHRFPVPFHWKGRSSVGEVEGTPVL